jgi:predicted transcriptional regulator
MGDGQERGRFLMTPPRAPYARHVRYGVRYQARLDAETSATLEDLATTFLRKRSVVLRFVMQWGLAHIGGWTVDATIPASPQLVTMLVSPELQQQVQAAATHHHITGAAWLRHAMRQVTRHDFPASWRAEETGGQSHESVYYRRKFGLRLDEATSHKLERLTQTFHRSAADVIRQLVTQAKPEDFPWSWRLAADEHRAHQTPSANTGTRGRGHS